ncbi:MAG: HAD family hydrolase [Deltaproteobacteria bacterium]|nr:HAD family hydrolase [Deltaproteobacteria bacterium]
MPRVAAFFDMDRTVLTVNTATLWVKYQHKRGEISRFKLIRSLGWAMRYRLALIDVETVARRVVADLAGSWEHDMIEKCRRWYDEEIHHTIAGAARKAIQIHREQGHRLVLLTAGTSYVAGPLAQALGLDAVLCSRLETRDGRFTGRLDGPACVGKWKVAASERWAEREGVDLSRCSFYTDSYSDLAMLERVGEPKVVNPDPRLLRVARRRGWPVMSWDGRK